MMLRYFRLVTIGLCLSSTPSLQAQDGSPKPATDDFFGDAETFDQEGVTNKLEAVTFVWPEGRAPGVPSIGSDAASQATLKRMQAIFLIDIHELTAYGELGLALRHMELESREKDKEQKGLRIHHTLKSPKLDRAAAFTRLDEMKVLKRHVRFPSIVNMRRTSFLDTLDFLCEITGISYEIKQGEIHLVLPIANKASEPAPKK